MDNISSAMFKGSLDIQASAAAALISGGAPMPSPAPQGSQGVDQSARAAGLQAQGIGQKVDTTA